MKPIHYTSIEGGNWKDWPTNKRFYKRWLNLRSKTTVNLAGLKVHSLAFDHFGFGNFPRWDCVNGITDKPEFFKYIV